MINLSKANIPLTNVALSDNDTRISLSTQSPTITLPFLETKKGNISQSGAIEYYICTKYNPELLGQNLKEKSQINQWVEFSNCEIARSERAIIYPILGWAKYDKERADSKIVKYKSDNAYGVLIEGIGLCGGYTDTMSLFLDKLNVKNYKVSTNNHTWNRVYVNDKWLHLDLTWDDPISEDGKNILDHNYFLITTNELKDIEKNEHNYNMNIYDN